MWYRGADGFWCTGGAGAGLDEVVISVVGGVACPSERNVRDQLHDIEEDGFWSGAWLPCNVVSDAKNPDPVTL